VRLSSGRLLLVLRLTGGVAHTIFLEVPGEIAERALQDVSLVLHERLVGLTLREIRTSFSERLRDTSVTSDAGELLNIFIQEAEQIFDISKPLEASVLIGRPSVLAEQPEFSSGENMRKLLTLTEHPEALGELLRKRSSIPGITITIGDEHEDPQLSDFTVVTTEYSAGALSGVIGVIGPTRMPYQKVISLVTHTSQLITELLD
jgi:heat-inducible transcriptional repressor